jgi:hypothetical protein
MNISCNSLNIICCWWIPSSIADYCLWQSSSFILVQNHPLRDDKQPMGTVDVEFSFYSINPHYSTHGHVLDWGYYSFRLFFHNFGCYECSWLQKIRINTNFFQAFNYKKAVGLNNSSERKFLCSVAPSNQQCRWWIFKPDDLYV